MRIRLPLVPLVLTVACVGGIVVGTTASGATPPVPVALQSGHWIVNDALSAALHVHGGTGEVDARVDLPPGADGSTAVAGASDGFVVGRDRVWTFDRSTLSVVSDADPAAAEVPVPIEVVGGPYLVYRRAGTIVRLGAPEVVVEAGGPLAPPVRTPAGEVVVHRPDTGALCALRRDALDLDCGISTRPGAVGGLTVVGPTAVFVDTAGDAAYRVLLGAGLDGGTPLGTDLPADALLGDRAVADRLPVVLPGENVLRLVDVGGLEQLRRGGPPIDVPLGDGAFSAPVVGESAVALLDLASGRLLRFGPDGARLGETQLPPGSTAEDLTRGEDGRLYLDETGGGRVHVVQPDGSVATVDIGDGRGPAVAVAPPPEQLVPVRPPLPGQVDVPPDVLARPAGAPAADAVVGPGGAGRGGAVPGGAVPGGAGGGGAGNPIPADGADPLPDQQQPDVPPAVDPGVPPVVDPGVPPVVDPGVPPVNGEPPAADPVDEIAPPTGVTGERVVDRLDDPAIVIQWGAPLSGPTPVAYEVRWNGARRGGTEVVTERRFVERDNFCSFQPYYRVRAISASGARSAEVGFQLEGVSDCAPDTEIISLKPDDAGFVTATVRCFTAPLRPIEESDVYLVADGEVVDISSCDLPASGGDAEQLLIRGGFERGSTHTFLSRTVSPSHGHDSDPVTVTIP